MRCLPRREVLALIAATPLLVSCATRRQAQIFKDPECGCCTKWTEQMTAALAIDFEIVAQSDRSDIHQRIGMPASLASCHTAVIDGLAFEGHVPSADIMRFLELRPSGYSGLAVSGIPNGSPGMESPNAPERFSVTAFGGGGTDLYAVY
jgi:hypothetical protein